MLHRLIQAIWGKLERQPEIRIDALIALATFLLSGVWLVERTISQVDHPITIASWMLAALIAAPLCLRRRFPLGSLLAIVLLALAYQWHQAPAHAEFPQVVPLVIGLYSVAAWDFRRRNLIYAGLAASLFALAGVHFSLTDPELVGSLSTNVLALVVGTHFYGRRARAREAV
ncbi:MAG TPA: hypothetical protein PK819_03375, partial [Thermomicrobiales bacterium]|nr:hypothetical protein [Thermomicrobiales bacterium]